MAEPTTGHVANLLRAGGREYTYRPKLLKPLKGIIQVKGGYRNRGGKWIKEWRVISPPGQKIRGDPRFDYGWVHPDQRVRQPNFFPGDKVRLFRGRDDEKYEEIEVDGKKKQVWRIHTVREIQPDHNRLWLEDVQNKQETSPRPDDYDEMTTEQQRAWQQHNGKNGNNKRPIQFSNVGLCVYENKDNKSEHVFATRLKSSHIFHINKDGGQYKWDRWATSLNLELPPEAKEQIEESSRGWKIPWPSVKMEKVQKFPTPDVVKATSIPTEAERAVLLPIDIEADMAILSSDETHSALLPTTVQSPGPTDMYASDSYLHDLTSFGTSGLRPPPSVFDTFMPLHLVDELAPRFAKHKMSDLYKHRVAATARARNQAGEDAIAEWEANGRDRNLRQVMDLDEVGLEGVPIRPRTKKEVVEAALEEFDAGVRQRKKDLNRKIQEQGMKWDYDLGGWVEGPKALNLQRKRVAKIKRNRKVEEGLRNLTLTPGKNMVVPERMRKEVVSEDVD